MVSASVFNSLTAAQRSYLLRHIDRVVPYEASTPRAIVMTLLRKELLQASNHNRLWSFPAETKLTEAGRAAVAQILSECADALVAAGCLEPDRSIRPIEVLALLRDRWNAQAETFSQTNPAKSPNLKNSTKVSTSS